MGMYKGYCGSHFGTYNTKKFTDIWDEAADFLAEVKASGIPTVISDNNITTLYYLLYARYGNNPIASSDEDRFKYQLYSIIFQYGRAWEKRVEIQTILGQLNLSNDDWLLGSRQVYNHAANPSTSISGTDNDPLKPLDYVDDQNVTQSKKGKLEGLALLQELIDTDVTGEFLDKFKRLFLNMVSPSGDLLYETEIVEDED